LGRTYTERVSYNPPLYPGVLLYAELGTLKFRHHDNLIVNLTRVILEDIDPTALFIAP